MAKLDHLGRDAQDVNATIKHWQNVKLMLQMLTFVAEMERDLLVELHSWGWREPKETGKC